MPRQASTRVARGQALLEAGKSDGGHQSRTDLDRSEYGRRQVLQREEEANKADCRPEIEKEKSEAALGRQAQANERQKNGSRQGDADRHE